MDFYGLLSKIIPGSVWTADDISEAQALIERLQAADNPAFDAPAPAVAETVAATEAAPASAEAAPADGLAPDPTQATG